MNSTDPGDLRVVVAALAILVAAIGLTAMAQGVSRHRSVSTGAARHVVRFAAGVLAFCMVGFGLGFAPGSLLAGTSWFGLADLDLDERVIVFAGARSGSWLLLHTAVAVVFVTAALVPLVERTTAAAQAVFAVAGAAVIYPLAARASGPDGLLGDVGVGAAEWVDGAGAGAVATVAGWAGLTGVMLIGPRMGRFGSTGNARVIPGRSMPAVATGSLIAVVGWVGLALALPSAAEEEPARLVTIILLGASAGALAASPVSWLRGGRVGSLSSARGLLAGAVSVSAGVEVLSPGMAVAVGAIGGALVIAAVIAAEEWRIDDPLGAVGIFAACGLWSLLAVGLFGEGVAFDTEVVGLAHGGGADQLSVQAIGAAILASWGIVTSAAVFGLLRALRVLRLPPVEELVGLSIDEQKRSGSEDLLEEPEAF